MPYRVFWSPDAERLFKNLHAASGESSELAKAAKSIDAQLHSNPYEFGESRDETVRIGFERPLVVQYDVLEDVQTVIVFDVRITKPRSP